MTSGNGPTNARSTTPERSPAGGAGIATLAGRSVARIGFGAMQLPGPGVWGPPRDRDAALHVLRTAVELGVNHIDTAQFYGNGVANELIRSALHPYPNDLILVSKVGATRDEGGGWLPAQRPEQLRRGVEANLRTLGTERLDVVNLRRMDRRQLSRAPEEQHVDLDSQMAEMIALRDEGLIGGIGLSNVEVDDVQRALPAGVACVQNAYSLLDRTTEPTLDLCRQHGIPWVPFFPLGSAFPNMPKVTEHPIVVEAAARLNATPAQVGLAWLLAQYDATLLIPGTSSVDHLHDNVGSAAVRLDPATLSDLEAIAKPDGAASGSASSARRGGQQA
jgi:aryl-alcohol dehydrogenase-like predicted oxidoreductase